MRAVLSDLAIESESAMTLWMRLAAALDRCASTTDSTDSTTDTAAAVEQHEAAFVRLGTAVAKYWVCKRAPTVAYEAMEVFGGNGYVEEGPMAALYRQAPLNGIWEGSGNVICLDVLRAIGKEPASAAAFFLELEKSFATAEEIGCNTYVATVRGLQEELRTLSREQLEFSARHLVDRLAICLAGSVLMQDGDAVVAKCFVRTRLASSGASSTHVPIHNLGAMTGSVLEHEKEDVDYLIERLTVN